MFDELLELVDGFSIDCNFLIRRDLLSTWGTLFLGFCGLGIYFLILYIILMLNIVSRKFRAPSNLFLQDYWPLIFLLGLRRRLHYLGDRRFRFYFFLRSLHIRRLDWRLVFWIDVPPIFLDLATFATQPTLPHVLTRRY